LQKKNLTLSVWLKKETWLFWIWLQAWVVSDCKKLKCVIAKTAGLFLWLQKKRKRKTEPVCDCNYLACVIATRNYVWLPKKRNLTLPVCLQSYLVVWNMIASLCSKWLQKTKVFNCKICWFISVTAKKKKKNWTSVRLQLFGVRDCKPGVMCVAKKPDFAFVLAKILGCLEYDCKSG
jgi:hypothetical protein